VTTETASQRTKQAGTVRENDAENSMSEQDDETTNSRGKPKSRGTGTGRGLTAKDSNRGAAAPPTWIHDPRPALDKDLWEEDFRSTQELEVGIPYMRPEAENQNLASPGYHFILDLALACRKFLCYPPGEENPISQIFELVKTNCTLGLDRNHAAANLGSIMAVDTLETITRCCSMAEQNSTVMDFVFMINAIQLRCKVIRSLSCFMYLTCFDRFESRTCQVNHWKKTPVLESIKSAKSSRTLARYVSDAAKFCLLAGGGVFFFSKKFQHFIDDYVGSVFILAIAAAADTRSMIRNYLTHDIVIRINYLLRCPNSGKCRPSKQLTCLSNEFLDHVLGKLIMEDIIPVIDILRRKYRATFSSMFNQELLFSRGVIPEVEAGDLLRSDEFFDSITYK